MRETSKLVLASVMKDCTCGNVNVNISHCIQDLGISINNSLCKGVIIFLCSKNQVITDCSDKMQSGQNSCCIKNKFTLYPL